MTNDTQQIICPILARVAQIALKPQVRQGDESAHRMPTSPVPQALQQQLGSAESRNQNP